MLNTSAKNTDEEEGYNNKPYAETNLIMIKGERKTTWTHWREELYLCSTFVDYTQRSNARHFV